MVNLFPGSVRLTTWSRLFPIDYMKSNLTQVHCFPNQRK